LAGGFARNQHAMTDDMIPLFSFPAVEGKKITAAFDGGRISSDRGVMLLSMAERRLGVAQMGSWPECPPIPQAPPIGPRSEP